MGIGENFGLKRRNDVTNVGLLPVPVTTRCYVAGITVVDIDMAPLAIEAGEFDLPEDKGFRAVIGRDLLSFGEFTYIGEGAAGLARFRLAFPGPPADPGTIIAE